MGLPLQMLAGSAYSWRDGGPGGLMPAKDSKLCPPRNRNDVSGSVVLAVVSGWCPKLFGDQRVGGDNPQVKLMRLCSTEKCQCGF